MASRPQKPGEIPQRPAEYEERGPRGGQVPKPRQVTIEPGDKPLPPTQKPDRTWVPVGPPKRQRP
ncbi:MAG: YjzC family protein [Chloroflexota bacterium]|nr:YjzC family protein [Chloroflexota bacterium]